MAQALRQSELFAGNDWLAAYRAFTEVNLNAFDFASIRQAMVDYIRRNYPEDFNDWIESSEFVAIIDLLSYLGQSLAFRTDINARENFLETARRRESVLRLARSLSYNARRNYPARGLAKITEVRSSHDVYDSAGRNLNNTTIRWDDPNNADWFEQWILVLNSSLIDTNQFGVPLKSESLDGIQTQLYRIDNIPTTAGNFSFNDTVNTQSYSFDVVNADFNTTYGFVEQTPDPNGSFHIIYRSDGNGNASPDTGFFVYFKQGTLQKADYSLTEPQENRTIFVDVANINETDVWVQSVNDQGQVEPNGNWTRVGHVPSDDMVKVLLTTENVTYNDIDPEVQNIYQVVTQEDDKIVLRFGDGRFGKAPVGNLRVWYRTSANENLSVRPDDISNTQISIPYRAHNNTQKRLSLTFSLQETVNNGVASETNADIRRRAARVSSTQGRMVSGSDYNELPIQTNLAVKLKAVNRFYSGQSRYIDLNDPTGSYQNTNVIAEDGAFYIRTSNDTVEVSHAQATTDEIMTRYVPNMISAIGLRDFFANYLFEQSVSNNFYHTSYLSDPDVKNAITERLELNRTFGLGFNNGVSSGASGWYVLDSDNLNSDLSQPYAPDNSYLNGPNSWLLYLEYTADFWRITSRSLSYVFESERACKFFFVDGYKSIDPQTGKSGSDTIRLMCRPNSLDDAGMDEDMFFVLEKPFYYSDGYMDASKVAVRFFDSDADGEYDFPNSVNILRTAAGSNKNHIVHQLVYSTDGYGSEVLIPRLINANKPVLQPGDFGYVETSSGINLYQGQANGINKQVTGVGSSPSVAAFNLATDAFQVYGNHNFRVSKGFNNLIYQWKHYAPSAHRIDPAISNIIDIFVLTREYNDSMVSWREGGSNPADMPKAPGELELRTTFNQLENYKMFSDEVVWRPVKFKLLFGQTARPEYQAKFKVVKLNGTSMSDGEIKSNVIQSIRDFFEVNMWDFGETFYFSELGAYIHRQLSTAISSIEIVPIGDAAYFGDLREIRCQPDEIFFATAQVSDVEIITANSPTNLRMNRNGR
jgi:hypothetical protein